MVENPYADVTESQLRWANDREVVLDNRGWARQFQDNLFWPIRNETRVEMIAGREIDSDGAGGRISAPHSSTAWVGS